ncbi:MAG TPA: antibiotic biosynthesis monooxygenase family protein [Actinomycetota bacterium]
MAEHFASGNWQVGAGKEGEFVERWTEFLQWTRKSHPGLVRATLLRDGSDPSHFVSFAEWADEGARGAWKQSPEFADLFNACRSLCEDFHGGDYDRLATI